MRQRRCNWAAYFDLIDPNQKYTQDERRLEYQKYPKVDFSKEMYIRPDIWNFARGDGQYDMYWGSQ